MVIKKRKQKQTLKEFKAWLQGVEELQPEGWSPNREQWQLIRSRIDGIIVEKKSIKNNIEQTQLIDHRRIVQPQPQGFINPSPEINGIDPIQQENITMTPAARQMLYPNSGEKAKTPDIDTSNGNITSSFA